MFSMVLIICEVRAVRRGPSLSVSALLTYYQLQELSIERIDWNKMSDSHAEAIWEALAKLPTIRIH